MIRAPTRPGRSSRTTGPEKTTCMSTSRLFHGLQMSGYEYVRTEYV